VSELLAKAVWLCVQVIDVSQVGLLKPLQSNSGTLALYAHAQQGAAYGNASDIVSALMNAAQEEASAATVRWELRSMRIVVCRLLGRCRMRPYWGRGRKLHVDMSATTRAALPTRGEPALPSCRCKAQCWPSVGLESAR